MFVSNQLWIVIAVLLISQTWAMVVSQIGTLCVHSLPGSVTFETSICYALSTDEIYMYIPYMTQLLVASDVILYSIAHQSIIIDSYSMQR